MPTIYAKFVDPTPGQEDVPGNCIRGPMTEPDEWRGYLDREHWPFGWRDDLLEGWTPTPALDDLRAAKWAAVKAERDRLEANGFADSQGRVFDCDQTSVIRMLVAAKAAENALAAGVTGFSVDWTLKDNTSQPMTAADLIGLATPLAAHADELHQHARGLRAQISAATTAEEIAAIPDW